MLKPPRGIVISFPEKAGPKALSELVQPSSSEPAPAKAKPKAKAAPKPKAKVKRKKPLAKSEPKAQRYYLHGDYDSKRNVYYCQVCDLFEGPEHFDECSLLSRFYWAKAGRGQFKQVTQTHEERYIVTWKRNHHRSEVIADPNNLFRSWNTDIITSRAVRSRAR